MDGDSECVGEVTVSVMRHQDARHKVRVHGGNGPSPSRCRSYVCARECLSITYFAVEVAHNHRVRPELGPLKVRSQGARLQLTDVFHWYARR